jgi:hypothetical protein
MAHTRRGTVIATTAATLGDGASLAKLNRRRGVGDLMMKVLILICAAGVPQAECSAESADAVIQGPPVSGIATCGLHGQAYIADTTFASWLADGGHYLKLRCTPERIASEGPRAIHEARSR